MDVSPQSFALISLSVDLDFSNTTTIRVGASTSDFHARLS